MKKSRVFVLVLAVLCLLFAFAACSASESWGGAASDGESGSTAIVGTGVERKIVYSAYVRLESSEAASVSAALMLRCNEAGGYVESQREYGDADGCSRVDLVLRVPTAQLKTFLLGVGESGKVLSRTISSTDITTQYVDAESKKAALTESKTALQAMREAGGLSASEQIAVIDKIAEIDAELQSIELLLTQYDSTLDYSRVEIRIDRPASYAGAIVGISIVGVLLLAFLVAVIVLSVKLFGVKKRAKSPPQA